jgi:acetolactate synthase-like protein
LKAHGIPYLFCLSGGHISPILVACEKRGIRIIDTRHEVNAAFAGKVFCLHHTWKDVFLF